MQDGISEIIEKKSKFIGYAHYAETEEEMQHFVASIRKMNSDANHNVFAYRLSDKTERQSDDGEPSGTAGIPILELLRGESITNTAIVVTRYFGGTLLGTGGLVRAYGKAAKNALYDAGVIEKIQCTRFSLCCDYHISGKVKHSILKDEHIIHDTQYSENVTYIVDVENALAENFVSSMTSVTNAQAQITQINFIYKNIVVSIDN